MAAGDQAIVGRCDTNILSTYLQSTSTTGSSTAGVADSNYTKVLNFHKVFEV
jgi:hypothetical protein